MVCWKSILKQVERKIFHGKSKQPSECGLSATSPADLIGTHWKKRRYMKKKVMYKFTKYDLR